ncbi:type IV pilus assembly protein PilM [Bacillaceae bacterium]
MNVRKAGWWKKLRRKASFLGLECKDSVLKLAEVERLESGYLLRNFVVRPLPEGVIEQGKVADENELFAILSDVLDSGGFRTRNVHLALGAQNVIVRPYKLPNLPDRQLREVARLEIETNIQLPFSDPVFDYVSVNREAVASGDEMDVVLVIAPRDIVMGYVRLLKELKLKPLSVDLAALAHLRLLDRMRDGRIAETLLSVNLSRQGADIGVFHKGILKLLRNIPLQPEEESAGLTQGGMSREKLFGEVAAAGEASGVPAFLLDLADEIERVMNFYLYTLNNREQQLGEIVLTGDGFDYPRIIDTLSERFQVAVTVETLDALPVVQGLEADFRRRAAELAVPVGLALKEVSG